MRRASISLCVLFALAVWPACATARGLSYWQAVRAVDHELATRAAREDLEISLRSVYPGTRVASVLQEMHYIARAGRAYRFTSSALSASKACDGAEPRCRVFAFGTSVRAGRPLLATLYSRGTTFNEPVWTYWFTYMVTPVTAFAMRAAREGLVDTISAPDPRCPAVWSARVPLLANASVGPDLPFQIEIKSRLYLHGAIAAPKTRAALTCDFAAMESEIEQTR